MNYWSSSGFEHTSYLPPIPTKYQWTKMTKNKRYRFEHLWQPELLQLLDGQGVEMVLSLKVHPPHLVDRLISYKNSFTDACSTADCCPLLTICPRCCPRHTPDMPQLLPTANIIDCLQMALSLELLNTALYVELRDQWNGPYFFLLKSHISAPGDRNCPNFFF